MQVDNLSVLKIHKFKNKEQYERAYANGEINETDVCLTPDEELDLSVYSKKEEVSKTYETKDDANSKLDESKKYTDEEITALSDQIYTAEEMDTKLAQLSREFNERFNSIQNGNEVAY